jgi:hypothetical protein
LDRSWTAVDDAAVNDHDAGLQSERFWMMIGQGGVGIVSGVGGVERC